MVCPQEETWMREPPKRLNMRSVTGWRHTSSFDAKPELGVIGVMGVMGVIDEMGVMGKVE